MTTQPESVRTIAVGVDGSPQSEAALRWALREAEGKAHVRAIVVRPHDDLLPGTSFAMLPTAAVRSPASPTTPTACTRSWRPRARSS